MYLLDPVDACFPRHQQPPDEAENNDRSFKSNRRNRNNVNQSKSVEEDNSSSDKVSKEAAE